jgi:hypothetical protein
MQRSCAHDTVKYSTWTPRELESRCLQRNTNNVPVGRRHRFFATAETPRIHPPRYQDVGVGLRPSIDCKAAPSSLLIKVPMVCVISGASGLQRAIGGTVPDLRFCPKCLETHPILLSMRSEHELM